MTNHQQQYSPQQFVPQWRGVTPVTHNQFMMIVQTLAWVGGVLLALGGVTVVMTGSIFMAVAGACMFVVGGVALVGVGVVLALRHP
jgi:hypothetical protein